MRPMHAASYKDAFNHTVCGRGIRARVTTHADLVTCKRCLTWLKVPSFRWAGSKHRGARLALLATLHD